MSAEGGGAAAGDGQQHLLTMPVHARYPSRLTIDMDYSGSPRSNAYAGDDAYYCSKDSLQ
jgi:hypothetical protein